MSALEAIRAAESAGARVYLGADGTPRMGNGSAIPECIRAELRANRDEVTRVLGHLERADWIRVSLRRLSGVRSASPEHVAAWACAARTYAETGDGLSAMRSVERAILAAAEAAQ